MTIDAFITLLAAEKDKHRWTVNSHGNIRADINGTEACPVVAVAQQDGFGSAYVAGKKLGLGKHLYKLMACADMAHHPTEDGTREKMLDALGLKEI